MAHATSSQAHCAKQPASHKMHAQTSKPCERCEAHMADRGKGTLKAGRLLQTSLKNGILQRLHSPLRSATS